MSPTTGSLTAVGGPPGSCPRSPPYQALQALRLRRHLHHSLPLLGRVVQHLHGLLQLSQGAARLLTVLSPGREQGKSPLRATVPAPWLKPTEPLGVREVWSNPQSVRDGEGQPPCQPQTNPRVVPSRWAIPKGCHPRCSPPWLPAGSAPPPPAGSAGTRTAPGSRAGRRLGAAGLPAPVPTYGDRRPSWTPAPPWVKHPPPHAPWGRRGGGLPCYSLLLHHLHLPLHLPRSLALRGHPARRLLPQRLELAAAQQELPLQLARPLQVPAQLRGAPHGCWLRERPRHGLQPPLGAVQLPHQPQRLWGQRGGGTDPIGPPGGAGAA